MLTFFNSESLWIGTDMKRFNQLRDVLEREGIAYRHKVKNRMGQWSGSGSMRGRTGSAGMSAGAGPSVSYCLLLSAWGGGLAFPSFSHSIDTS